MKKDIIIQFSGGIDSLYAAHYLAPVYDRIHLLTFDKGYLHLALKANRSNVDVLRRIHGEDKFIQTLVDIKGLFKEMGVKSFKESQREFGSEIAWCIPCRASMALGSIIYALENGIAEFTDGANWEQAPDGKKVLTTADNYPEFLECIRSVASSFGLSYLPILYELNTRKERRDTLLSLGAKIDFNSLDKKKKSIFNLFDGDFYKRYQPMCLSGYFIHWKRNFFNVREETTAEMTVQSIRPKLETVGKRLVREYFEKKGMDVDRLEAALAEKTTSSQGR